MSETFSGSVNITVSGTLSNSILADNSGRYSIAKSISNSLTTTFPLTFATNTVAGYSDEFWHDDIEVDLTGTVIDFNNLGTGLLGSTTTTFNGGIRCLAFFYISGSNATVIGENLTEPHPEQWIFGTECWLKAGQAWIIASETGYWQTAAFSKIRLSSDGPDNSRWKIMIIGKSQ